MFLNDASLAYQCIAGILAEKSVMDKTINERQHTIAYLEQTNTDLEVTRTPNNNINCINCHHIKIDNNKNDYLRRAVRRPSMT